MRYQVTLGGRTREVEVRIPPDGPPAITLDGRPVDARVERVEGGVLVHLGGRVFDVAVGGAGRERTLAAGPYRAVAEVVDEQAARREKKAAVEAGGGLEVRTPMPGRVVEVRVAAGDAVTQGQPVVVVEAMKMQNELRSPADGVVAEVLVEVGAAVEGQAVLVRLEG